ncbi:MAG: hypothetical protein JXR48_18025 [Candidatus Delongbacteria bacterium]|nr:hypothetical protein [Candidatus Delongbacteria bacterium]MBN2836858.1 hypothetical protein [Candidatus Delongbacteria bacterium]
MLIISLILIIVVNLSSITPVLLSIPTPDGYGQAVHPDIFKVVNNSSFKYGLSFTPFPYSMDIYENPCIVFTNDGINVSGSIINNPIIKEGYTPEGMLIYNNDPDVVYDERNGCYLMAIQNTYKDHSDQNIDIYCSKNLNDWNMIKRLNQKEVINSDFSLSPSLVINENLYYLFFVNWGRKSIKFLRGLSIENFNYHEQNDISINIPTGHVPWHIDVFKGSSDIFYMLICCAVSDDISVTDLFLATSKDLKNWNCEIEPILRHGVEFFNSKKVYRSTGFEIDGKLKIWFSIHTNKNEWRIGYTEKKLK